MYIDRIVCVVFIYKITIREIFSSPVGGNHGEILSKNRKD